MFYDNKPVLEGVPPGTLVFDLETDGLLDTVTKIHVLCTQDFHTGEVRTYNQPDTIADAVAAMEEAPMLVGHNILKYDLIVLEKLYGRTFRKNPVLDTILLTRLLWPELKQTDARSGITGREIGSHSLKTWGKRLKVYKGDYTGGWENWSQEMQDYCVQDVTVTVALLTQILRQRPTLDSVRLETDFQRAILGVEVAGFSFANEKARKLLLALSDRRDALNATLSGHYPSLGEVVGKKPQSYTHPDLPGQSFVTKAALTAHARYLGVRLGKNSIVPGPVKRENIPFNPASRHHRAAVLRVAGWVPPKDWGYADDGVPDVDEASLAKLSGYAGLSEMIEYLMVEKRLGQLSDGPNAWMRLVKPDGRVHGQYITNGCVTGRCSHIKPNMAQVPGVKDRFGQVQPYGRECRELFTVPDGYELMGCDASSLELRCLAHYLAAYDGGEYAKLVCEGDVHTANMEAAGLPSRALAKTFIYAYLYGAGDAKLGTIVGGGLREGKKLRAAFQYRFGALARLQQDIRSAAASRGYLKGIDGRKLHVRGLYSALNTLLQSAGGLLMKEAYSLFDEAMRQWHVWGPTEDWCGVVHVHDEWQTQVRKGLGNEAGQTAVECIREAGNRYRFRVPLAGEFRVGATWADTH